MNFQDNEKRRCCQDGVTEFNESLSRSQRSHFMTSIYNPGIYTVNGLDLSRNINAHQSRQSVSNQPRSGSQNVKVDDEITEEMGRLTNLPDKPRIHTSTIARHRHNQY